MDHHISSFARDPGSRRNAFADVSVEVVVDGETIVHVEGVEDVVVGAAGVVDGRMDVLASSDYRDVRTLLRVR